MKQFFKNMIDSTNPANSKVFTALVTLMLIIVMVVVSLFKPIQMDVFYSLCMFCAAALGLSAIPFRNK